jgi:hypothetical protein
MTPILSPSPAAAARLYGSDDARQEASLAAGLRNATVTARSLGLSLGKFGLSYQSADITLAQGADQEASRARRIFSDAVEASRLYEAMSCPADSSGAEPCGDTVSRLRQGLAAYSRQSRPATVSASSMLSVLV